MCHLECRTNFIEMFIIKKSGKLKTVQSNIYEK